MGTSLAKQSEVYIYVQEGEKKRLAGDFAGAIADFNLALQVESKSAFALSCRGAAKRGLGDFAGAIADMDKALQLEPKYAFALSIRGECKRMLGDYAGAIEDLDKALQLEPKNAFALGSRGDAKRMLDGFAGAIADLDSALKLEAKNVFALRSRGAAKIVLGDFAGAIADLDLALQLQPKNAFALGSRGDAKRLLDDFAGAIADLDLALELEPNDAWALSCRSEAKRMFDDLAGAIADLDLALHLEPKNAFALKCRGLVIEGLLKCLAGEQLKWAVIGAGPVGLALAMSMAVSMQEQGRDTTVAGIDVYESRWVEWSPADSKWRRNKRRARDQVVTLQDAVVDLLAPQVRSAFHGEKVWLHSRNVPVAEIEERLLEKAQQPPFCNYIRIHKGQSSSDEQAHAQWLKSLDADVVVAADGAGSMCRRAFRRTFISPNTEGANMEAQQIRLGETTDDFEEADFALGIALKPDARPPQSQAMNVVLTLAQNVYLLNSQEGSRGYLNIRITKEEYDAIFEATNRRGCTFGNPIGLFKEEDLHLITDDEPNEIRVKLPWLRRRIEEGLRLFGMQLDHMQCITGFQLRPSYAENFYHVLPNSNTASAPKVLLLAGDAAISHHFWPGRGLNTGLKSAVAIVKMWQMNETFGEGVRKYNVFMDKLRQREMQGRSASMMRKEMRLPWAGTLSTPRSSKGQQFKKLAKEQEEANRQRFLENCKLWKNFMERSNGWPHERLTDEELDERILYRVTRPKELELHLMVLSAFDNGPGRAAGWPTSKQGGAEVDPSDETHWR